MQIEAERHVKGRAASPSAPAGLLDALLGDAAAGQATHIHIETGPAGAAIALRVAGRIQAHRALPPEQGAALVQEIGVRAGVALPPAQPARGELRWGKEQLSAALLPILGGVRVVLQRTPDRTEHRELEALGMRAALAQEVRAALAHTGLVLVAAPPGHGRSRTLRTLLGLAAHSGRPGLAVVRADADGVPGVAWLRAGEIGAAEALRAGAVQDVDVLLLDSLEDRAAAAAAADAAANGRLVLAGIEASDAIAAIQQMRSWRVEAFQLASTLSLVLGQRLVRRLCASCREPVQATGSVSALLGFDPGAIVYAAVGCAVCDGSGFAGRTGVFEAIRGDATIRRLVNDGGDAAILARHAFVTMPNLGSAARALARTGVTTPEEAVRISRG
ncbi:ATPase, T2SS/T4P/T4SS family [Sphingomonas elodea]|uniref:ATPase, T2SS/T4P/T4SS family n=1 Tax=Sphingomonas elodea TaxID=179878 RepID=UPI00026304F3|nr:ATPase, T2SS/T4P/T4SS family [Sphingomonas elodea]